MIISTGTKYRSIAAQNILSYSVEGNISNTNGIATFGLSGDNGNLNLFTFKTGKIYDTNNKHVWSYNPSENFIISGNIETGFHNYYINDNIICLSSSKPNNYYKYFYISAENNEVDFDVYTYGNNNPSYQINFPFRNIIGDKITGYIYNSNLDQNLSIQFFTGNAVGSLYYSVESIFSDFISGQESKEIILNYTSTTDPNSFNSGNYPLNNVEGYFVFKTNFGEKNYNFVIPVEKPPFYFIDFVEIFTGALDSFYNYTYELRTKYSGTQDVTISLANRAGHNNEVVLTGFFSTGFFSSQFSNFIYGYDYITGLLTGNLTSIDQDYYGNNLINFFSVTATPAFQFATGLINYYYNLPIPGGSGLFEALPGTFVLATGSVIPPANGQGFIYRFRENIENTATGVLTGYWYDLIQTGTGLLSVYNNKYFTGQNIINYSNLQWNSIPSIGYDIETYGSNNRIYGITGSGIVSFLDIDSGIRSLNQVFFSNQNTGILTTKLFNLDSSSIGTISGKTFGSENIDYIPYVFSTDDFFPWGTDSNISTGFLGFEFFNFSPADSGIISHYEINLDKNFPDYKFLPRNFKLQGSNNFSNWTDMDTRTGVDFYQYGLNVFSVTGTGNYNFVRLLISSGVGLPHLNPNEFENYSYGLFINKINFYKKLQTVTGKYRNFIENDATGNYFYSSFNTGGSPDYFYNEGFENDELYYVTKLDKEEFPEVLITGSRIIYKTARAYTGYAITGFYASFSSDYDLPFSVAIEASTDGIVWNSEPYKKTSSINLIESGLFSTGVTISPSTPFQYFALNLKKDYGLVNSSCTSGWQIANSPTISNLYQWNDIALSNTAQKSLLVTNFTSGNGPYTGYIFQNVNGHNGAFESINFTGNFSLEDEVKLKSVAFDKNTGRYILVSRDGNNLYTGNFGPSARNYKIYYNATSGQGRWIPTGFDGAWVDVAMSHNGQVMAAVGNYFASPAGNPFNLQVSRNNGVTWTSYLAGGDFSSVAMSSGGNVIYATRNVTSSTALWRSVNSGSTWSQQYFFDWRDLRDIATDNSGKHIILATEDGIYNSQDSGVNFTPSAPDGMYDWIKVAMSNDAKYQLAIESSNHVARSENYGVDWTIVTDLENLDMTSAAISRDGQFQYVVGNGTRLYNNCTYSNDVPILEQTVGVKKFNLYTTGSFDAYVGEVTGYGLSNYALSGTGVGTLFDITGKVYQPAISYETGLLNGLIIDGGSYTWENVLISSTGSPGRVFVDYITGFENASGVIKFSMDLIRPNDFISINDTTFNYDTGISDSNYTFHDLFKLMNVLNSGATGGLNDFTLSNIVGVTGGLIIGAYKTGLLTGLPLFGTYGESVDISDNNIIVVGGPNDNSANGAAIIYTKNEENNWIYSQKITGSSLGRYGTDTHINNDGTKIVMSGPNINSNLGGFVVYSGDKTNGWSLQQFVGGYYFSPLGVGGYARYNNVAINSGDIIAIGGYNWGSETGIIAIYTGASNFTFTHAIIAPSVITSTSSKPRFGSSVALNNRGNILVVGAPHSVGGYGNVCIYDISNIISSSLIQTFSDPDNDISSVPSFGSSLGINSEGNIIVVGTPAFTTGASALVGGYRLGLVSIYTGTLENNWSLRQNITGTISNEFFGNKVDISSDGNIIGISAGGSLGNTYINYIGNPIDGWSPIISASGLKNTSSIAVNNNITVGGYNTLSIAAVSEINNVDMQLFSHNPSGEDGNNTKLYRYAENLEAIIIPNRYLISGRSLRPLVDNWTGNFIKNFESITAENSGIYATILEQSVSSTFSGVLFENNFSPNWSANITPISEGVLLNTGLTINLLPDIYWRSRQVATGTNANNANLGSKVFIVNNIILASQPNGSFAGGTGPGPVIFYTGNQDLWRLGSNLTGNFGINPAQFGTSLATWNGSPIVFGGPLDNNGTGSALIYTRNTPTSWILRTKLTGIIDKSPLRPFGGETSKYGTNVAVSSGNDIILMSSPWNNTGYGSTLIYTGNVSIGWIFKQELVGKKQGFYGSSLGIDNNADVIVLGGIWGGTNAPFPTDGGINIFTGNKINGWQFAKDISGENAGNYGSSVAVNKDASTIVIGGPFDGSGAILVYTGNKTNSWQFSQKISGDFSQFGQNVSISDDDIIVVSSDQSNKTCIFIKNLNTNEWELKQKFIFDSENIGNAYISNSGTIVVGLPNLDSPIYSNAGGFVVLQSGLDILTGMYKIPSGLPYLGYSGLNINFNKRYLEGYNYNNFADYTVSSDKFVFTGTLKG